jgi:hypothetical protein
MMEVLLSIVAAAIAVVLFARGIRHGRSRWKIWWAGKRRLRSTRAVIWRDPGPVENLDLAAGPGGRDGEPVPPFTFIHEHQTGTHPSVSVRDARNRKWRVKWGVEVQAETLATRLVWAAGYFAEPTYYVAEGVLEGAVALQRAANAVDEAGCFRHARFEVEEEGVIQHFEEHSWAWNDNPFVGTAELNGLKIVMMWVSNWDAKDVRDVGRGSNTAIFEYETPDGRREARYLIIDWGGAFGRWGNVMRGRWDCAGFMAQTDQWVQGVDGEFVRFGYTGQRTADIAEGIRVSDVTWLMRTLGRLTDRQIAAAVAASGGTPDEVRCFTRALRARLDALQQLVAPPLGT